MDIAVYSEESGKSSGEDEPSEESGESSGEDKTSKKSGEDTEQLASNPSEESDEDDGVRYMLAATSEKTRTSQRSDQDGHNSEACTSSNAGVRLRNNPRRDAANRMSWL